MKNIEVYIEQIPEHFKSELSITINCKRSESQEAQAIIDYLSSIINIVYKRSYYEGRRDDVQNVDLMDCYIAPYELYGE